MQCCQLAATVSNQMDFFPQDAVLSAVSVSNQTDFFPQDALSSVSNQADYNYKMLSHQLPQVSNQTDFFPQDAVLTDSYQFLKWLLPKTLHMLCCQLPLTVSNQTDCPQYSPMCADNTSQFPHQSCQFGHKS